MKEEFTPRTWNYRSGGLFVDLEGLRVISHDCGKQLTPRGWALLRVFIKHASRVVAPRTLLHEACGQDCSDEERTYVNRLHRKIEPALGRPHYLLLERDLEYRLAEAT